MSEKIEQIKGDIEVQNNDDLLDEIMANREYIIELHNLITKKETKNE
jgi:hypothetical protein